MTPVTTIKEVRSLKSDPELNPMLVRYLIYEAYTHYENGDPIPASLFIELTEAGVVPEVLHRQFSKGFTPPFCSDAFRFVLEYPPEDDASLHVSDAYLIQTIEDLEEINRELQEAFRMNPSNL